MATRAGVAECSTSDMAVRSRARSIRARPTTGYCGAVRVIRSSISTRCSWTLATSSRASSAVVSSRSVSARCRSRIAVAVRWPKSASKIEASASLRPWRRPRRRSAPDAIDDDDEPPSSRPSSRSTVAATALRTWAVSETSGCPGRATSHTRTSTLSLCNRARTALRRAPASAVRRARRAPRPAPPVPRGGPSR